MGFFLLYMYNTSSLPKQKRELEDWRGGVGVGGKLNINKKKEKWKVTSAQHRTPVSLRRKLKEISEARKAEMRKVDGGVDCLGF
jgi:hypothetical protein